MPASTAPSPTEAGAQLSVMVGGFGSDEPRLQQLLRLFPVPMFEDIFPLLNALKRVASSVSWVPEALGQRDLVDFLSRVLGVIAKVLPPVTRFEAQSRFKGAFILAGTMVGSEPDPMPGPENLRAAIWVCLERWNAANRHARVAVADVGSALRNSLKTRGHAETERHPVARYLGRLGEAHTLQEFIDAAKVLLDCGQIGVEEAWTRHFQPELEAIAAGLVGLPEGPPLPAPLPVPPPRGKRKEKEFDEDEALDAWADNLKVVTILPDGPLPAREIGEPLEEVLGSARVIPLRTRRTNRDAKRMAIQHARQVMWGTNHLLLTNHPDALPASEFSAVIRILVDVLRAPERDSGLAYGCAALLLQGITGRTAKTLRGIRIVDAFDPVPPKAICELCLGRASFRLGVFWLEDGKDAGEATGYFRPSPEQSGWLHPVASAFALPIPPAVVEALRLNSDRLIELAKADQETVEACLREAARHVSGKLGIRVNAGHIRRSFAAHLFELCRDTALTQLVCADTLGQSTTPQHYYSPTASTVAQAYWTLLQSLLGTAEPLPEEFEDEGRVGSALLVKDEHLRKLVRAPAMSLRAGVTKLIEAQGERGVHEAMVNHLACMLLALAGHRPVDALFELTLRDLHLDRSAGGALFRDKIHDAAHDPRLVALAPTVVQQVMAYLSHLNGMAERQGGLRAHVVDVLAGKAPLLFAVEAGGGVKPITIREWKTGLPDSWRVIPLHWGRTWIRTRGIESGLRPELASMHLGHLEAVGYPFSHGGPTDPEAFLEAVCPVLEKLADRQGWMVRQGVPSKAAPPAPSLPPLRKWAAEVRDHERALRDDAKAWRLRKKSRMNAYRVRAEQDVLGDPALRAAGISAAFESKAGPWVAHTMTLADVEAVRDSLFESAKGDEALGLARVDALVRVMRKVNQRMKLVGRDPSPLIILRRPVENAFVPGMMEAVRQVRALRDAAEDRALEPPGDWRDFSLACARTAEALAIFGGCEDPAQIEGIISHRHEFTAVFILEETILVPWGPRRDQVIAARGLAAQAVLRLAKKYPIGEATDRNSINASLAALLPRWTQPAASARPGAGLKPGCKPPDLLAHLCETVSVANRFELPPSARLALDQARGSTNAHPQEQVALVDGDAAGTLNREWEAMDQLTGTRESLPSPSLGNARSQYLGLCRVIPRAEADLCLPLTHVNVSSLNLFTEETRLKVIAEVRAMLAQEASSKALQPVVRLLATWVLEILEVGTPATPDPADITIYTYLTRIGGGLEDILGSSSLQDLDEAELEDIYLAVILSAGGSRDKAAASILAFHECCCRNFDFPDAELAEVMSYLRDEVRRVDARLILPTERAAAVDLLTVSAGPATRAQRQAGAAMPFYAYGGARRSEILGAKFSDLSLRHESPWARIRANRSRRLKTRAARRIIHLATGMPDGQVMHFAKWIDADRSRIPSWQQEGAYVFSSLDGQTSAAEREKIAKACREALAVATGRPLERMHRLRHLVAFEQVTPLFLSADDAGRLKACLEPREDRAFTDGIVLPRDLMARVITLGHSDGCTTIVCYHHLPWLLRSRRDAAISKAHFGRRGVATVTGRTLQAVDRITQLAKHKPAVRAWFDALRPPRLPPAGRERPSAGTSRAPKSWGAAEVGALLKRAAGMDGLQQAMLVSGEDEEEAARMLNTLVLFEQRLGRRLTGGDQIGDAGVRRPRRVVRRINKASDLEQIWQWFDENTEGRRQALDELAKTFYDWMSPADRDWLKAPVEALDRLEGFLVLAGADRTLIDRRPTVGGIGALRLRRKYRVIELANTESGAREAAVPTLGYALKQILGVLWAATRLS